MAGTPVDLIKEKLDIVDVIKGYVTFLPAGKNFKALCPFHKEKTPSFIVSPDRQSWHCFGNCSAGGDIFSFVMRYENIEFAEALKLLAEKAGVELRRMNPAEYKYHGLLYDLNDQAKEFFKQELTKSEEARAYLKQRALLQETIEEFEIGFAPNQTDALVKFFLAKNVSPDDVLRAGLTWKSERGGIYDRFRGRVMFPIHNHLGKVVGFTGRVLPQFDDGKMGKYVNSPETAIFNKSKVLYGLHKAKNYIREAGHAFLVEGQMDMIMSWQAGVRFAVASSGTAFTPDHMRLLSRLTEELLVGLDNDAAGMEAGERAIDLAEASDFRVKVVRLAGVKDPAEAAEKDPALLVGAIARAVPAMEFYFEKYLGAAPRTADSRRGNARAFDARAQSALRNVRAVLRRIKGMASPVERSFWTKELGKRTGIAEEALQAEAANIEAAAAQSGKPGDAGAETQETAERAMTRRALLAEELIGASWAAGDMSELEAEIEKMPHPYPRILELLKVGAVKTDDPMVDEAVNRTMLRARLLAPAERDALRRELAAEHLKDRRRELALAVRRAEEDGNEKELEAALVALGELPSA